MLATTIEVIGTRAAEIAMASGAVLACPAVWRYFRNGRNGKNGKTGFDAKECSTRGQRIATLEAQYNAPTGFNPDTCQKHSVDIATLTEKIHSRFFSVDRRIGELRDGVKDIADRMPPKP